MQELADDIFARYLRDRPKAEVAVGASFGSGDQYAFLSGPKSPYGGIDTHSLFEIGAISKTLTALLLEKAVLTGLAAMSTPVYKVVPELHGIVAASMTVRQLAVHTSGLPYDFPLHMTREARQADRDPWALLTREDLYRFLDSTKVDIPGSKWRSSNVGYSVLAMALENIYGATYPEILRQHVFEPLHMVDSVSSTESIECATRGHCGKQRSPYSESALLYGPGDVRTSIHDLLNYVNAALHADRAPYEGFGQYLFTPGETEKSAQVHQGLGWTLINDDRGWLVLANGATCGFSSCALFSPTRRKAVVVLANHVDIGGLGALVKAGLRKNSTVQGATQLLYNAL